MPSFAVLSYLGTDNIGDEIQSLAACGLLPRVDHYIDRDNMNESADRIADSISLIANGWHCQHPERWPPCGRIRPLFISMHITREKVDSAIGVTPSAFLTSPPIAAYLRRHAPIGARDLATRDLLTAAGVESYFSGCLTLTLPRPKVAPVADLIVLNDLPPDVVRHVRGNTRKSTLTVSHVGIRGDDVAERFHRGRELLALYARASCVVTTRLHCALPCLAMGTPVLLVEVAADSYRFSGLMELLWHCRPADLISGAFGYDFDTPPANMTAHQPLAEGLIARVDDFVGSVAAGYHSPD